MKKQKHTNAKYSIADAERTSREIACIAWYADPCERSKEAMERSARPEPDKMQIANVRKGVNVVVHRPRNIATGPKIRTLLQLVVES